MMLLNPFGRQDVRMPLGLSYPRKPTGFARGFPHFSFYVRLSAS